MPSVHFINTSGERETFVGKEGESVMELGVRVGIPQIEAECGGAMACATCHVYVEPDWLDRLPSCSDFKRICWIWRTISGDQRAAYPVKLSSMTRSTG
jgi:2Fe-2S ferredoxin